MNLSELVTLILKLLGVLGIGAAALVIGKRVGSRRREEDERDRYDAERARKDREERRSEIVEDVRSTPDGDPLVDRFERASDRFRDRTKL